jgi:ParB-like chromosome segregation protein Spo0J
LFPLMSDTDPKALRELAEDIKKNGLKTPIVLWRERWDDQVDKFEGVA